MVTDKSEKGEFEELEFDRGSGDVLDTERVNNIRFVSNFGDPETDIGDSIQRAHDDLPTDGGMIVFSGSGTYPLKTEVTATKSVTFIFPGRGAVIEKQADVRAFDLRSPFMMQGLWMQTDGSGTSDNIRIYDCARSFMMHCRIDQAGNDNIVVRKGNGTTFTNVYSRGASRHGVFLTNDTDDNNNLFFNGLYITGCGGTGLYAPWAGGQFGTSRQHAGSVNTTGNTKNGEMHSRNCSLHLYVENGTFEFGTNSKGNYVVGNAGTITDNGSGNIIWDRTASYEMAANNLRTFGLHIPNDDHTGTFDLTHPADSLFEASFGATSGALSWQWSHSNTLRHYFNSGSGEAELYDIDRAQLTPRSSNPAGGGSTGDVVIQDGTNWDPAGTGQEEVVAYLNGGWVALS